MDIETEKNDPSLEWPDPKTVPSFPYQGEIVDAYVYNVYDGDTCSIIISLKNFGYMKLKIRVIGVDTPEIKIRGARKNMPIGDLEKKAAIHVRDKVKNLIEGKVCQVRMDKWDKYGGRVIGVVYLTSKKYATLTEYLLANGYAKKYYGSKKEEWKSEELNSILSH